jgi:hypothetical protein
VLKRLAAIQLIDLGTASFPKLYVESSIPFARSNLPIDDFNGPEITEASGLTTSLRHNPRENVASVVEEAAQVRDFVRAMPEERRMGWIHDRIQARGWRACQSP